MEPVPPEGRVKDDGSSLWIRLVVLGHLSWDTWALNLWYCEDFDKVHLGLRLLLIAAYPCVCHDTANRDLEQIKGHYLNLEWWVKTHCWCFPQTCWSRGNSQGGTVDPVDQCLVVWWAGICLLHAWQLFNDKKRANVTAVFKTDKMKDPGNSSPVSFTSFLWRTMERVLLKVISRHVKHKKETGRTQSNQRTRANYAWPI